MKHFLIALSLLMLGLSFTCLAQHIPGKISYQGLLTTSAGTPLPNGSYDIVFQIFNLPVGGALQYTDSIGGVPLNQGAFSVLLGPMPAIFNESLYVQVTVIAGPGLGSPMTFLPRSELTAAPFSLAPWVSSGNDLYFNSGNVGIGVKTPLAQLHVKGSNPVRILGDLSTLAGSEYVDFMARNTPYSTDIGGMRVQRDSSSGDVNTSIYAAASGHFASEKLHVGGNGYVGIGTTAPSTFLSVIGSISINPVGLAENNGTGSNASGLGGIASASGGTTHVGVGGTALNGVSNYGIFGTGGGGTNNYAGYFNGNLAYTGSLINASDATLKEDIQSYSGALEQVLSLQPRTFKYKSGQSVDRFIFSPGKHYGFIAQEVEKVFPDLVVTAVHPPLLDAKGQFTGDPVEYKALKTMELIPILVGAMQEQQKLIEQQQKEIEELQAIVGSLSAIKKGNN